MMTMRTTARKWRSKRMCPLENHKNSDLDTPPPPTPRPPHPTTIYKKGIRDRVWHFGFETSRFRNFLIFFNGIGIGFGKFWYRKKYRYRFRKNLVSKKVSVSVSKIFGIEKSIGFEKFDIGFEKFWYRKKYQFLKILLKKQEILSKISRGGDACFCR